MAHLFFHSQIFDSLQITGAVRYRAMLDAVRIIEHDRDCLDPIMLQRLMDQSRTIRHFNSFLDASYAGIVGKPAPQLLRVSDRLPESYNWFTQIVRRTRTRKLVSAFLTTAGIIEHKASHIVAQTRLSEPGISALGIAFHVIRNELNPAAMAGKFRRFARRAGLGCRP